MARRASLDALPRPPSRRRRKYSAEPLAGRVATGAAIVLAVLVMVTAVIAWLEKI